jgi:hypothetical protein
MQVRSFLFSLRTNAEKILYNKLMDYTPTPSVQTPPALIPSPMPVTPKQRMHPVAIAGIFVTMLLAGYGVHAYFTESWPFTPAGKPVASESPSPMANPMAGWETYANTQYGFEVKYPADVYPDISGSQGYGTVFSADDSRAETYGGLTVSIIDQPLDTAHTWSGLYGGNTYPLSPLDTKSGTWYAYRIEHGGNGNCYTRAAQRTVDGKTLEIRLDGNCGSGTTSSEIDARLIAILNTFSFMQ